MPLSGQRLGGHFLENMVLKLSEDNLVPISHSLMLTYFVDLHIASKI